jgi:hypothetical protein
MLCSHVKKFIYFKTKKTAGTSVEIYFEKYCVPEGQFVESHDTVQKISEAGIVGSRMGGCRKDDVFFNHMPGDAIKSTLGDAIFNGYRKFCVFRNPFTKVVSQFWWDMKKAIDELEFSVVRSVFNDYLNANKDRLCDRHIYTIKGQPVFDLYLRYESLASDLEATCRALDIEYEPSRLGHYKSDIRNLKTPYPEYYTPANRAIVERQFAWEIEYFGYEFEAA